MKHKTIYQLASLIMALVMILGNIRHTQAATSPSIYWGAYLSKAPTSANMGSGGPIDTFETRSKKKMAIIHWGQPWQMSDGSWSEFQTSYFDNVRNHGSIPMMSWTSQRLGAGMEQANFQLRDIYAGTYDAYITRWATAAKNWGHPFFLRFDHEMNGWWFPWGEGKTSTGAIINGNSAGDYVKAWRHVHDIFTSVGATNVTWVWAPNIIGTTNQYPALSTLYPGDAYVDWTGLSVYNKYSVWLGLNPLLTASGGITWLKNSYNEVLNIAPTKPMMLAEWASIEAGDGGAKKAAWIKDALTTQIPTSFPKIKAVIWFNFDMNTGETYPIESSQASIDAWAAGIASTIYATNQYATLNTSPIPPLAAITYITSGNTGVADVTLQYMNGTPRSVLSDNSGNYSITVPLGWSGTVEPTHPCFTFSPTTHTYSNIVSNQTGQDFIPTIDPGCADVRVQVSSTNQGRFGLPAQSSTRASFNSLNNGPVKVVSSNAIPLIGAERVIYKVNTINTSFSEMMGLPNASLDTIYWLPWYNNVDLDTQLRFGNVSANTAHVHVFIGANEMSGSPFTLTTGQSTRVSFAGVNDGPVQIQSDQNIVATERVIYRINGTNTSFTELMALPSSQLNTTYWLPWYNNIDLDTQLRFANVTGSAATVHVYIGNQEVNGSPFLLQAGEGTRLSVPGVNEGPVQIQSDQNIVAAERVIYKVSGMGTSFSEMMALPNSQVSTTYWLPWYNNVNLDTQLRFANVTDSTATVHVYIGGVEVLNSPFTLNGGQSIHKSFAGLNNGPVKIVSDQNIVAAQRVLYKVNNVNASFADMMALPNHQLDTTYWLPWYNNVDLDTQLRFGAP